MESTVVVPKYVTVEPDPIPVPVRGAGPMVASPLLITAGQPIADSFDQRQRVIFNVPINLGPVDTAKYQVFISGEPNMNSPLIVDDCLSVNGRWMTGFSGVTQDPKRYLGQNPFVCYTPVEAIEVTQDLRHDGILHLAAIDVGGWTYCCSRLYLRVVPR